MSNRIEELLLKLYNSQNDRFYSHLFFQVSRKEDKNCQIAGVGIKDSRIQLVYNDEFMRGLRERCAITVLKHEAMHLINQHLIRGTGAKNGDRTQHMMENIAMDTNINQLLDQDDIKEIGGVTLDSFKTLLKHLPKGFQVKPHMPYEYYYNLLADEREQREKNGEGDSLGELLEGMGMDDHSGFGEMDALDRAMLEDKIRKAAESAKADGAGRLPSEVEEMLKILKKPVISWKRELKQFVGFTARAERKSTRSKRNRRYGIVQPGKKRDYLARILVILDTSGSMSGSRTDKVLSELYGIYKAMPDELNLDICECDAQVQDVFTYNGKDEFKIAGRGGTDPDPALEYASEHGYDGVIVLTDGEFWQEPKNTGVQTMWVVAENSRYTAPFGKTVNLD